MDQQLQTPALEEYLSLIHATDEAFAQLVDYFSQVEQDTIILLFGDHQPGLGDDVMAAMQDVGDAEIAEGWEQNLSHLSSFVIWANFDLEEASDVLTSPNYLRAMVLEQAGMELTPYEQFLLQLQEDYPALNYYSYLDAQGMWHGRGGEDGQGMEDYACLVYNNVFDKKHMNPDHYQ